MHGIYTHGRFDDLDLDACHSESGGLAEEKIQSTTKLASNTD